MERLAVMAATEVWRYELPGGGVIIGESDKGITLTRYEGEPYRQMRLKKKYSSGKRYKSVR